MYNIIANAMQRTKGFVLERALVDTACLIIIILLFQLNYVSLDMGAGGEALFPASTEYATVIN